MLWNIGIVSPVPDNRHLVTCFEMCGFSQPTPKTTRIPPIHVYRAGGHSVSHFVDYYNAKKIDLSFYYSYFVKNY
jgi:hypothetical protein